MDPFQPNKAKNKSSLAKQVESLSEQYKKIGLAETQTKSLIFETRIAQDFTFEILAGIANEGLLELENFDGRFHQYRFLFDKSSHELRRELLTRDQETRLAAEIDELLMLLSRFFLLKSTHQVLEYLIRRYRICEMNIGSVLRCILPYHQTNIFARMVQLLEFSSEDRMWEFLRESYKTGTGIPRSLIVNACRKNLQLLDFIADGVEKMVKGDAGSLTLLTFFSVLMTEFFQSYGGTGIPEDVMRHGLPWVLKALKSQSVDYFKSGCMILGLLLRAIPFEHEVITWLLEDLSAQYLQRARSEAFLVTILVCQTQKVDVLPKSVLENLTSAKSFLQDLQTFHSQNGYDLQNFFIFFFRSALTNFCYTLLHNVFSELSPQFIGSYVGSVAYHLLCALGEGPESSKQKEIFSLLQLLNLKYPTGLDQGIERYLQSERDEETRSQVLQMISTPLKNTRHQILPHQDHTLFIALHSASVEMRLKGFQMLEQNAKNLKDSFDVIFFEAQLLKALSDPDLQIRKHVLTIYEKVWQNIDQEKVMHKLDSLCWEMSAQLDELSHTQPATVRGTEQEKSKQEFFQKLESSKKKSKVDRSQSETSTLNNNNNNHEPSQSRLHTLQHSLLHSLEFLTRIVLRVSPQFETQITDICLKHLLGPLSEQVVDICKKTKVKLFSKLGAHAVIPGLAEALIAAPALLPDFVQRLEKPALQLIVLLVMSRLAFVEKSQKHTLTLCAQIVNFLGAQVDLEALASSFSEPVQADAEAGLPKNLDFIVLNFKKSQFPLYLFVAKNLIATCCAMKHKFNPDSILWKISSNSDLSSESQSLFELAVASFCLLGQLLAVKNPVAKSVRFLPVAGPEISALRDFFGPNFSRFLSIFWCEAISKKKKKLTNSGNSPEASAMSVEKKDKGEKNRPPIATPVLTLTVALFGLSLAFPLNSTSEISLAQNTLALCVALASNFQEIRVAAVAHLKKQIEAVFQVPLCFLQFWQDILENGEQISGSYQFIGYYLNFVFQNMFKEPETRGGLAQIFLKKLELMHTETGLMSLVQSLHFVKDNQDLFQTMFPLTKGVVKKLQALHQAEAPSEDLQADRESARILLARITPTVAPIFNLQPDFIDDLIFLLSDECGHLQVDKKHSVQTHCFKVVTPEFFNTLNTANQEKIFQSLLEACAGPNKTLARKVLGQLTVPVKLFVPLLTATQKNLQKKLRIPENEPKGKRRKQETTEGGSTSKGMNLLNSNVIHQLNTILEILTEGEKMTDFPALCPHFIELMRQLEFAQMPPSEANVLKSNDDVIQVLEDSIEYTKQLLLNILDRTVSPTGANLSETQKGQLIDTIIDCAKTTRNPQTRNRAISFLGHLSHVVPKLILNKVLPFFTFLGPELDDNYTFRVLQHAVTKLSPPIAKHIGVTPLLQLFISNFELIPSFRLHPLFVCLIKTVGEQWLSEVVKGLFEKGKGGFAHLLCIEFGGQSSVLAFNKMLKEEDRERVNVWVEFIADHLCSEEFLNQVLEVESHPDPSKFIALQTELLHLFVSLIQYLRHCYSLENEGLIEMAETCLENLNTILAIKPFLTAIAQVLNDPDYQVRGLALRLLNEKIDNEKETMFAEEARDVLKIPGALEGIIKQQTKSKGDYTLACLLKQQALKGLEILVHHLGQDHPETFLPLLGTITDCLTTEHDSRVVASVLTCFALMCSELKDGVAPHLKIFLPRLLAICVGNFRDIQFPQGDIEKERPLLQSTALSSLELIIERIPHLLSPWFSQILATVLQLSTTHGLSSEILKWTENLIDCLARQAPARILFSPIIAAYRNSLTKRQPFELVLLLVLLSKIFANMKASDMTDEHSDNSLKFLLLVMGWRKGFPQKQIDEEAAKKFENAIAVCFSEFVFKLKERTFKNLFETLVSWGTEKINDIPSQALFYQILVQLGSKLKFMFVSYYAYFWDHMMNLLSSCTIQSTSEQQYLLKQLLVCIQNIVENDREGFLTSERFHALVPQIVAKMDFLKDSESADLFFGTLKKIVVGLAMVGNRQKMWENLLEHLLEKTKSPFPNVRSGALLMVGAIYKQIGEPFVVMTTMVIPYLSECMEDSDLSVEKAAQELVEIIESSVGGKGNFEILFQK